jgi:hypothetical protein
MPVQREAHSRSVDTDRGFLKPLERRIQNKSLKFDRNDAVVAEAGETVARKAKRFRKVPGILVVAYVDQVSERQ